MTHFVLPIFVLFILKGGRVVSGKAIGADSTSGVTFFGSAADRFVDRILGRTQQWDSKVCKATRPSDCGELNKIFCPTGVYTIYPDDTNGFDVLCEMEKIGGGWTVFQRRQNGLVNFYRNWATYKQGFGSLNGDFWLGNDNINKITSQGLYTLRIDLSDFENNHKYAVYSRFSVAPESSGYKLEVKDYSGDAGDGLKIHNAQEFSTKDKDNDKSSGSHCALLYKAGWWYANCHQSNLNGLYLKGNHSSHADGVNWFHWRGNRYSMKTTTMMIRRTNLT